MNEIPVTNHCLDCGCRSMRCDCQSKHTDEHVETLARTIIGEARSEGYLDMLAVAAVVRERAKRPGWWGRDVRGVCLYPWQFTCWSDHNRKVCENAETLVPSLWPTALGIAHAGVHLLRDRDVLQLFGVADVNMIPTHYFSPPLTEPPVHSWGTDIDEVVVPWRSVFRFYVVRQGRPARV